MNILREKFLHDDPPKALGNDPQDAIRRIGKLLTQDWQNIGASYLALQPLWSYSTSMKDVSAAADDAEDARYAQADVITAQYKARVSSLGQSLVDGFGKVIHLISSYIEALNHQNAHKLQTVGLEIQQLGQSYCQQIVEFEKLCKSPPNSIDVKHGDGRKEQVKLQIDIAQNASMAYILAIKPIAYCAANILKDPANSLMEIVKHLPKVQAAMTQVEKESHAAVPIG